MNKQKILFLDLETSPSLAWVWSTGKQYVGHTQILEPTKIICAAYKFEGKSPVQCLEWTNKTQDDKPMLVKLSKVLEEADVIIAHNGANFDMKHINARMAFHDLPPIRAIMIEDTLKQSRSSFKLASHSLAYLAKYFKVGAKMATGGIDLWLKVWLEHDIKAMAKMVKYCKNDVVLLEKVYNRLKRYLSSSKINRATASENHEVCPSCGGKTHKHGVRQTSPLRKVQIFKCIKCLKQFRSGLNLLHRPMQYPR